MSQGRTWNHYGPLRNGVDGSPELPVHREDGECVNSGLSPSLAGASTLMLIVCTCNLECLHTWSDCSLESDEVMLGQEGCGGGSL